MGQNSFLEKNCGRDTNLQISQPPNKFKKPAPLITNRADSQWLIILNKYPGSTQAVPYNSYIIHKTISFEHQPRGGVALLTNVSPLIFKCSSATHPTFQALPLSILDEPHSGHSPGSFQPLKLNPFGNVLRRPRGIP